MGSHLVLNDDAKIGKKEMLMTKEDFFGHEHFLFAYLCIVI
jgi:hypothetical protein